ncbi:hypothetical protein ACJX0J_040717, partial [Zea mays]
KKNCLILFHFLASIYAYIIQKILNLFLLSCFQYMKHLFLKKIQSSWYDTFI